MTESDVEKDPPSRKGDRALVLQERAHRRQHGRRRLFRRWQIGLVLVAATGASILATGAQGGGITPPAAFLAMIAGPWSFFVDPCCFAFDRMLGFRLGTFAGTPALAFVVGASWSTRGRRQIAAFLASLALLLAWLWMGLMFVAHGMM